MRKRVRSISAAFVAFLSLLGFVAAAVQADEIRIATQPIPHYAPIS